MNLDKRSIATNHSLSASFITILSIVLSLSTLGYISLRYLQGYEAGDFLIPRNHILVPPQDGYKTDSEIIKAVQFLSRHWNANPNNISILVVRRGTYDIELGMIDSSSLSSARVMIAIQHSVNVQKLIQQSLSSEGNIYLFNEFKPTSKLEAIMTRAFYTTMTPGVSSTFGVIVWTNLTRSGDGHITALTAEGYLTIPVIHNIVLKRAGWFAN